MSLLQNNQETGITYSGTPLGLWFVPTAKPVLYGPYPHPYFGRKFLVFLRLQTGLRCKIVKTMKFPAKSSRIWSYGLFQPLLAASGWKEAQSGRSGRCLKEDF